jgi:hypothetical protein
MPGIGVETAFAQATMVPTSQLLHVSTPLATGNEELDGFHSQKQSIVYAREACVKPKSNK